MSFQIDDALTPEIATLDPSLTTAAIGALMLFPDDGDVQSQWLRLWQMETRYAQRNALIREDLISLLEQFVAGRENDVELEKLWRERLKLGALVGMQTYLAIARNLPGSEGETFDDFVSDMEDEGLISSGRTHRRRAAALRPVCYLWAEWFRAGWAEYCAAGGSLQLSADSMFPCELKNMRVFLSNAIKLKIVGMSLKTHPRVGGGRTVVPSDQAKIRHLPVSLELWAVENSAELLDPYVR